MDPQTVIRSIYRKLAREWRPQHWWPAETPLEVIVGAILAQNTSWRNVERALMALRAADVLNMNALRTIPLTELEQLIRSSRYFRQKAARLKEFIASVDCKYGGSVDAMLACSTYNLRAELMALKGVGPETADSILLYAGQHPIFVVDAYTRRVLERHEAVTPSARYDAIRELVECALRDEECLTATACRDSPQVHPPSPMSTARREPQAQIYNEMHGLFVHLGKHCCTKKQPNCELCPLGTMLPRPVIASDQAKSQKTKSNPRRRASKKMARAAV